MGVWVVLFTPTSLRSDTQATTTIYPITIVLHQPKYFGIAPRLFWPEGKKLVQLFEGVYGPYTQRPVIVLTNVITVQI
jgi:hypothetical protein